LQRSLQRRSGRVVIVLRRLPVLHLGETILGNGWQAVTLKSTNDTFESPISIINWQLKIPSLSVLTLTLEATCIALNACLINANAYLFCQCGYGSSYACCETWSHTNVSNIERSFG
jgi:hypothetical protein